VKTPKTAQNGLGLRSWQSSDGNASTIRLANFENSKWRIKTVLFIYFFQHLNISAA
jgi:hypothetical protein